MHYVPPNSWSNYYADMVPICGCTDFNDPYTFIAKNVTCKECRATKGHQMGLLMGPDEARKQVRRCHYDYKLQ